MKTFTPAANLPMRPWSMSWWHRSAERVALWRRRAQERQVLATMSERELRDIGLSWLDAVQEARKPFWRG